MNKQKKLSLRLFMDSVVLLIHIAFGSVALLTAGLAFLTEKAQNFMQRLGESTPLP